jgi:glycosyltransferase involved in cell wall biosynthesis
VRSWKGHRDLLQAIAALHRPDVLLVIVGDGPQRAALEALASELRLADSVFFAGDQVDVAPWIQAMDVFCLPSYANEGVPQALMQAMACGLPVVTTPVGSIAEIVADGVTGVLVPPEDSARLAASIESLLDDDELRRALGERAAKVAAERFGDVRMVERMLEVFHGVARPRHG